MLQRPRRMEGDLQRVLGRNLRNFREAEEMSQEAFAERLGYHRTYWSAIERGERNLTLQSVERIAAKLKIEPLLLLDGQNVGRVLP
jgi:transcriptional regulator with XRE-family HTH domain